MTFINQNEAVVNGTSIFFCSHRLGFLKEDLILQCLFLHSHCEKAKYLGKVTFVKEIHPVEVFQLYDFLKFIINTNDMEP